MVRVRYSALFVLALVLIATTIGSMFALGKICEKPVEPIHDTIFVYHELSEWEVFTMAVMKVESRYNEEAVNVESGARGLLQIMPIYVAEYNRISGNNFGHDSAFDPISSLVMWESINDYYNPERDFEKAVYTHNPKAGDWYRTRVFNAMDEIKSYEKQRRNVIEMCFGR